MSQHAFLSESEEVRTSYLIILGAISTADRENTPEEIAFMEQMATVAGLSEEAQKKVAQSLVDSKSVNLNEHLSHLKDNELKYSLVSDLLNLSYQDGELEPEEVKAIKQVNSILDINEEQYEALKQFVQKANKEAEAKQGNAEIDEEGQPQETQMNFLSSSGLENVFKKTGIPTKNFMSGSTIGSMLTSAAFVLIKNYMSGAKQGTGQGQTNTGGGMVGSILGSLMGGGQQQSPQGQANQGAGLQGMLNSFIKSGAGQAAMGTILSSVMQSNAKGKGMGNLMDIIGGGKKQQGGLQDILGAFLK